MRESYSLEPGVRPPHRSTPPGFSAPRTGRASVGIAARTAGGAINTRISPSPSAAAAAVQRILATVDGRIVALMERCDSPRLREESRIEFALLTHMRRALSGHTSGVVHDVVLCDSMVEFSDNTAQVLADLDAGGLRRLRRLLEYNRQLASELAMLGVASAPVKAELQRLRASLDRLDTGDLPAAVRQACDLYRRLVGEIDKRCPRPRGSLLDDLSHA